VANADAAALGIGRIAAASCARQLVVKAEMVRAAPARVKQRTLVE
jgi:hypothetical protein